jgi:acetyl-CoA synthetase
LERGGAHASRLPVRDIAASAEKVTPSTSPNAELLVQSCRRDVIWTKKTRSGDLLVTTKSIWEPGAEFIERTNIYRFMRRLGLSNREEFLRFSRDEPEAFWDQLLKEINIEWFVPYEKVMDCSLGVEWARWFVNGKLNIAWNCLERHARGTAANDVACIGESEDGAHRSLTFAELDAQASQLAHAIETLGLSKGDRVALYLPTTPEVVVILYACFKLGLVVVPIFSGFGPTACATRLQDSGARVLFTADGGSRRGKTFALKARADEALERARSVEKVVVYRYRGVSVPWDRKRDIWWHDFVEGQPTTHDSVPLDSEDVALMLYTSGTTGRPKGTVHTQAGCLAKVAGEIYLAFDHQRDDRFFWLSDIGWMMGSYTIIGNHHFGGTVLLYDGAPDHPEPDRLWRMIERHHLTTFCISPTTIRAVMRKSVERIGAHDLSSLRLLGSTGEPWDEDSYLWFFHNVGKRRCPIINICGGTEIIGSFLCTLPIQSLKPCSLGGPAPGMATEVFNEQGQAVRGEKGFLVCTKPAPSMTRGLWNDPERYITTYWSRWNGVWNHGDWASVDEDGEWFVYGRADEAFNVAGRKVGPAEVESALIEHEAVSEAAVIGVPDEITGEGIVAFVVLKPGVTVSPQLMEKLRAHTGQALGPTLRPRAIHAVPELPKTQSGKIVRRAIRQAYLGEQISDSSTIENPAILQRFRSLQS